MNNFKKLIATGFTVVFGFAFLFSSCVMAYFSANYPEKITDYLHKKDGEWKVNYWDYYAYENETPYTHTDSLIADTVLKPNDIWIFTNEKDPVHNYYRSGYIEFADGSRLDFEWYIDGLTLEEYPDLVMNFDNDSNVFNESSLHCLIEFYQDDLFRFNFTTGSAAYKGFHSENSIELGRK